MNNNGTQVSLEIFPPKTTRGTLNLWKVVNHFCTLKPDFISVTCGAGGFGEGFTQEVSEAIKANGTDVVTHMTAINKTRDQITETLDNYWQLGLRRILAIRGDYPIDTPKTSQSGDLRYAVDLIKIIKSRHDFDVTAAAYPEIHPETADASKALDYLKAKVDAGASQLITQFFIDPDVFLSFRDAVADAGITAPLVPGIIPIVNFAKVTAFAQKCGTTIPQFLHDMFAGINSGTLDHKLLAMNILSHQITRLHDEDVRRFHLFTLNELTLTQHICHWIRAAL